MKKICLIIFLLPLCVRFTYSEDSKVLVELDTSEVPEMKEWGETAKRLLEEWHPRIANLLPTKDFVPPAEMALKLKKSEKGVGGTTGTRIQVSSHWIRKHPEDLGLVVHELVHVIQRYPKNKHGWLTEGIADYIRWAIYEGKPQAWFPAPRKPGGYKQGYRITAGFFLWLESDASPGIVKKLNTAARNRKYDDEIFLKETGRPLETLWDEYKKARSAAKPLASPEGAEKSGSASETIQRSKAIGVQNDLRSLRQFRKNPRIGATASSRE